jgi:hypothetical protein
VDKAHNPEFLDLGRTSSEAGAHEEVRGGIKAPLIR